MYPSTGNFPLRPYPAGALRASALAVAVISLLVLPTVVAGQASRPVVTLPIVAAGTDSFLHFDLGTGTGYLSDRLRDPLQIRVRVVTPNLFETIGRPTDQAAVPGEILLAPIYVSSARVGAAFFVEASTGYVAFFDEIGRNNRLGEILVAIGRPFEPLASTDGNFALLMRRENSGRTEGAYLYHASTGRALYVGGLRDLETDLQATPIANLPQLTGRVSSAVIQSGRKESFSYLIVDSGNGDIYFFDLERGRPSRVAVRKSGRGLTEVFAEPGQQVAPQRFVTVPVLASDDRTQHIFVLDATSGDMALIEDVDGSQPGLRKASLNLYSAAGLSVGTEPRHWQAIPNLASDGRTEGIWIKDSVTSRLLYISNPGDALGLTVQPVATGG